MTGSEKDTVCFHTSYKLEIKVIIILINYSVNVLFIETKMYPIVKRKINFTRCDLTVYKLKHFQVW